ncbi:MAG: YkgJ family cysteine cluster protein [Deltaproteobacteria bacterium]|nr:YkgJ family cysteine cluster protein [Deltaproteobacteria bacterium]
MLNATSVNNRKQKQRMTPDHLFKFHCHPGLPCFTHCCQDVTIVLTPYDIIRLKNNLDISSDKFLDKYTIILPKEKRLIPLVLLQMNEEDKKCPFISSDGCKVYSDRPWACRMFPLDLADDGTFRLIIDSSLCKGLNEKTEWSIAEWLAEQGVVPYDDMNTLFSQVTQPLQAEEMKIENADIQKMIFMVLYNIDKFREFVFKSTFLDRFELSDVQIEKIKRSDPELLKFGFDWIKFGLFGQLLFKVKEKSPE